ncbi:MAG: M55 family metallopeptidase [Planctomycetes bacterium]|nr:M55 family metallopeptidase [Planctomycetota bacterium]
MKVFVSVDMEGISGITLPEQVSRSESLYAQARQFMTQDANACAEGCFRGGARQVVIWDAHASGFNMLWDQIDPRVTLSQGRSELGRMHDIASFDALILLGYHAMAGTKCAVLEHTMSSAAWQNFWLNGRKAGELAIDAGIAGDAGVPCIMTSGDDKLCREARSWIKGIYTAQVKTGLSSFGARLLSPQAAHKLIADTAEKACSDYRKVKPLKIKKPVKMRLELVERRPAPRSDAAKSFLKQIDGRTYEVSGASVREALSRL